MIYADRLVVDLQTGETRYVPVDNEWVLANRNRTVGLSLDRGQIQANGVDKAILSIQYQTPMLIDGSHEPVAEVITLQLQIDDETFEVTTDDTGFVTEPLTAAIAGVYPIVCNTLPSNEVTLTAV